MRIFDVYETMLDQDEMWFIYEDGGFIPVYDAALMDC